MMEIISEQQGGSDTFYVYDEEDENIVLPCKENTRSYVFGKINRDIYDNIKGKITGFRRDGIKVTLFKPGDEITYDNDLLMTNDYSYPDGTNVGVSSLFTEDVIVNCDPNSYYLFAFGMIWCREYDIIQMLQLGEN